jgi:hypothetical protein
VKQVVVIAIFLGLVAVPADASTITIRYTGRVAGGIDEPGLFGRGPGASLTGLFFEAKYQFDTSRGFFGSGRNFVYIEGGESLRTLSPAVFASIMIAGHIVSVDPGYYGQIYAENNGSTSGVYHEAFQSDQLHAPPFGATSLRLVSGADANDARFPSNFVTSFISDLTDNVDSWTVFQYSAPSVFASSSLSALSVSPAASFQIDMINDSIEFEVDGVPVPEPSAVFLLVIGLTGLGILGVRTARFG